MKTEIRLLIERQNAGNKLAMEDIHALMDYALELLKEIECHTKASIDRANTLISEHYKKAA